MSRVFTGLALICVGLCAFYAGLRINDANKVKALRSELVGTWRLVSMEENGQENALPRVAVTYKHITPGGFVWLSYEQGTGRVVRSAGGTYTLRGNTYTEKVEYGMGDDYEIIENAEHSFTCKIEGDEWRHTGSLANGTTLDEVWERVVSPR